MAVLSLADRAGSLLNWSTIFDRSEAEWRFLINISHSKFRAANSGLLGEGSRIGLCIGGNLDQVHSNLGWQEYDRIGTFVNLIADLVLDD